MNPEVYDLMVRYSTQLRMAGRKRLSIALITERVRWETAVKTTGDDFKINNNFRALYARKIEQEHPEFEGMFVMRKRRSL
jgi:hypothetical protein